ncbi:MAG: hypothetical protein ABH834_08075 [Candidatus Altiarchaeota archaeon]
MKVREQKAGERAGLDVPDPVFRGRSVRERLDASAEMASLFESEPDALSSRKAVNGFHLSAPDRTTATSFGPNPMELREVRFMETSNACWNSLLADTVGFPLRTDGAALIPVYGDVYVDGKPLDEDALSRLGSRFVRDSSGEVASMCLPSYWHKRKVYVPGEFPIVVARGHEVRKGNPPSTVLHNAYRMVSDPKVLESHVQHFDGRKAEETLTNLQERARKHLMGEHGDRGISQALEEYVAENFTRRYLLELGRHLQSRTGTAQVWDGCALTIGGVGANYYGHLQMIEPGAEPVVGPGEVVTKTGKDYRVLGERGVFVGKKALVDTEARGVFLEESHQPVTDDIPIGACGVEQIRRVERDRRLLERGAVFSEMGLDVIPWIMKADVDRELGAEAMVTQTQPVAQQERDKEGIYVLLTVCLDDTRRLYELIQSPLDYIEFVTSEYLDGEERRKAGELIGKLRAGRESADSPVPDDAKTVAVNEAVTALARTGRVEDSQLEGVVPGLSGKEALLLAVLHHTAAVAHVDEVSRNMGRNLRALMQEDLNIMEMRMFLQNIGVKGGLCDTGDLKEVVSPGRVLEAIAASVETPDQYVAANFLMDSIGGINPEQEDIYRLWVTDLFKVVEAAGMDPLRYMSSRHFDAFMVNFLGGDKAGHYYASVAGDVRRDFTRRPPADMGEAVDRFSGTITQLLDEYSHQQSGARFLKVYDLLQESPHAKRAISVNSAKGKTPAGTECFVASDSRFMVTPSQFVGALNYRLTELGYLPGTMHHYDSAPEYQESMRNRQTATAALLDEMVEGLSDPSAPVEPVGWTEGHVIAAVGSAAYGNINWERQKDAKLPEGEHIHLLADPGPENRSFVFSDWMFQVMYQEDAGAKGLSHQQAERRFVAEILRDLRNTVVRGDWGGVDEDHGVVFESDEAMEAVSYSTGKIRAVLDLFERADTHDYHGGMTEYMSTRITPREREPASIKYADLGSIRFDWLDKST